MSEFEHRQKPPATAEERQAKKEKYQWDAVQALADRKRTEEKFRANYDRLRAERKARESN
jgi:hypothetical protein